MFWMNKMSKTIADRAKTIINLSQYLEINRAEKVSFCDILSPEDSQYILRMIIREPNSDFKVPEKLKWVTPIINEANNYQKSVVKINHSFVYLTIRHGLVISEKDDEWHVDGFSMRINHIPEQNYIWSNIYPTEVVEKEFKIPENFNPLEHNIHSLFQKEDILPENIKTLEEKTIYCIDPYVFHRRPIFTKSFLRTFIRVSFVPIEINDINNTQNPLIYRKYNFNGIKFREGLQSF